MPDLDRIPQPLLTGEEEFIGNGRSLRVLDYWKWSGSRLMDNTIRGILAEFLVAAAVDVHQVPRKAWSSYDLCTSSDIKIEVKSAAEIQSHRQKSKSSIEFSIAPVFGEGKDSERSGCWADFYVVCVLKSDKPLDLDRWRFCVLATAVLDKECPRQNTIRLNSLLALEPHECRFGELRESIETDVREFSGSIHA